MRILWSIHLYPPKHNCGSEYVAHAINKFLISRGHEVRVVLHQAKMHEIKVPYSYDGVDVFGPTNSLDQYRWADVILTHLDFTRLTINIAQIVKRPVFNFVHNDHPYECIKAAVERNYIVYNSEWIARKVAYNWPSIVVPPVIDTDFYDVNDNPFDNEYITLINLDVNKGGRILKQIAKAMPDRKFLGVMGSYSEPWQDGQITDQPDNVKIVPNTTDILQYYRQTRILIMPSKYESWGRTAAEAMCSGIPVICTPTPGLRENCGEAAIYLARNDINAWVRKIRSLDSRTEYRKWSDRGRQRSAERGNNLEQLETFLYGAVYGHTARTA